VTLLARVPLLLFLVGTLAATPALGAQSEPGRSSVPPGKSVDGAPPLGGAIVGGSIERGENKSAAAEAERCRDLEGTLKAQCLRDAHNPGQPPLPRTAPGSTGSGTDAKR
jgi:hypothetical protein